MESVKYAFASPKTKTEVSAMDFFVEKSEFVNELNFVRGAVDKRSTLPILSHFLLEAEGFQTAQSLAELAACRATYSRT